MCLSHQKPFKKPPFSSYSFEKQNLSRPSLIKDEGEKKPGVSPQKQPHQGRRLTQSPIE